MKIQFQRKKKQKQNPKNMAPRYEDSETTGDFEIDFFSGEEKEEHPRRFVDVTEKDVTKIIEGEENSNTKRKASYDLNLLKKFLVEELSGIRDLEKIPPTKLDSYLSQFVLVARAKTRKDYELSSPRRILSSIERHLSRASYGKTIFKDSQNSKQN